VHFAFSSLSPPNSSSPLTSYATSPSLLPSPPPSLPPPYAPSPLTLLPSPLSSFFFRAYLPPTSPPPVFPLSPPFHIILPPIPPTLPFNPIPLLSLFHLPSSPYLCTLPTQPSLPSTSTSTPPPPLSPPTPYTRLPRSSFLSTYFYSPPPLPSLPLSTTPFNFAPSFSALCCPTRWRHPFYPPPSPVFSGIFSVVDYVAFFRTLISVSVRVVGFARFFPPRWTFFLLCFFRFLFLVLIPPPSSFLDDFLFPPVS